MKGRASWGAIAAGILCLVLLVAVFGGRLAIQSTSPLSCIVEDTRTGGGAGVERWAARLGYRTTPLRAPLWEVATELNSTGNCVITAGTGSWNPWSSGDPNTEALEWPDIDRWIAKGNTLIAMTDDSDSIPHPLLKHFWPLTDKSGTPPRPAAGKRERFSISKTRFENVPTIWGGTMRVVLDGPRYLQLPEEMHVAGHPESSVVVRRALGNGMVILLLDRTAWTNEGFDQADNAATLARLLREHLPPGGVLAFDEYRHGRGRVESFVTLLLSLPGARPFSWMAAALAVFWAWGCHRRLGPPDEFREVERRTAREYIESVAAMYRRARAAPLAVEAVRKRVLYLLKKKGIAVVEDSALLESAREQAERQGRPAVPREEIELVGAMVRLRKERYGTRTDTRAD